MHPLIQLPKTARLSLPAYDLVVQDHKITSHKHGIFDVLLDAVRYDHWDDLLSQMISQGFKLEAVKDQCIKDLKNPQGLANAIGHEFVYERSHTFARDLLKSQRGQIFAADIIKMIRGCKNWKQFEKAISIKSDFWKAMICRIKNETIAWEKSKLNE